MSTVLAAAITGCLSLLGVILSNLATGRKTQIRIQTGLAVMDTRLETLTGEVRELAHFAQRMPVAEEQLRNLERRIAALEERVQCACRSGASVL